MSIPIIVTLGPLATADADFFVLSATPVSGTALTLAATTVATARRVLITHGNEASARTLRLTGTNADGNPIRETLTIPSGGAGTVQSTMDFLTISEAMPLGGGWTAAMTLGTNGVASTPWKLVNAQHQAQESISWGVVVNGTVSYSIEYCYENPNDNQNQMGGALGNYPTPPTPRTLATMSALAVNADASIAMPFQAWRAKLNSGTGSIVVTAIEGGMAQAAA